jgi:hypothetical protein
LLIERESLIRDGAVLRSQIAGELATVRFAASTAAALTGLSRMRRWIRLLRAARRFASPASDSAHHGPTACAGVSAANDMGRSTEASGTGSE